MLLGRVIAGIIGVSILVALMPYIMTAMAELEGTIVGYCQFSGGAYRVTLGDDIRSSGIYGTSIQTEAAAECTKSTNYSIGANTFVLPSNGVSPAPTGAYTYVPTATSNNNFVGLISTIVNLWPVLLIVLLLFAIFKLFGGSGLGVDLGGLLTGKNGSKL